MGWGRGGSLCGHGLNARNYAGLSELYSGPRLGRLLAAGSVISDGLRSVEGEVSGFLSSRVSLLRD